MFTSIKKWFSETAEAIKAEATKIAASCGDAAQAAIALPVKAGNATRALATAIKNRGAALAAKTWTATRWAAYYCQATWQVLSAKVVAKAIMAWAAVVRGAKLIAAVAIALPFGAALLTMSSLQVMFMLSVATELAALAVVTYVLWSASRPAVAAQAAA